MSQHGMDCIDCHGTMSKVSENSKPWLNEPRCDSAACHGGDSTPRTSHCIANRAGTAGYTAKPATTALMPSLPVGEPNDAIKFLDLQNVNARDRSRK